MSVKCRIIINQVISPKYYLSWTHQSKPYQNSVWFTLPEPKISLVSKIFLYIFSSCLFYSPKIHCETSSYQSLHSNYIANINKDPSFIFLSSIVTTLYSFFLTYTSIFLFLYLIPLISASMPLVMCQYLWDTKNVKLLKKRRKHNWHTVCFGDANVTGTNFLLSPYQWAWPYYSKYDEEVYK